MNDIIVGLQYGDEGKGKITHYLINKKHYTHCVRFNGGPNAGHTLYINDKKVVTHQVPTGIINNLICVIGPNCVIDIDKLKVEIEMLESNGITNIRDKLKIAYNAHIIEKKHIEEDKNNNKIGTTNSGIGPTYRDKVYRCGTRACDIGEKILGCQLIDTYDELNKPNINILFEGAQGFMLDVNWGVYPYTTSSECLSYSVCSTGIPFTKIREVYGICKLYNTYVGTRNFQPQEDLDLIELQKIGEEFGSTTGRVRQCNWLNLDELIKATVMNGVSNLIINKCDVIDNLKKFKLYYKNELLNFKTLDEMKQYITDVFTDLGSDNTSNVNIVFSSNRYTL